MTLTMVMFKRLSVFDMKRLSVVIFFCAFTGLASFSWGQEAEAPDKPAEYFFYRCAGCHTIGGGKLTGPDLITAAQWSSADLGPAIKKMEKNVGPLSEPDIAQMIEFLKDLNVSGRITRQKQRIEAELRAELPPPSFETGQKLFSGQKTFLNGGPACFSCHHFVNEGGSLGPDLTHIKDRASGVVLQSAVENASYRIMRSIYEKRKISKEESLHLSEFLTHPEKAEIRFVPTTRKAEGLALGGVGGFFVLLWVLNQRRKGPTRKNLLRKNLER